MPVDKTKVQDSFLFSFLVPLCGSYIHNYICTHPDAAAAADKMFDSDAEHAPVPEGKVYQPVPYHFKVPHGVLQ